MSLPTKIVSLVGIVFSVSLFFVVSASAQTLPSFPVKDLGNCADASACREYCSIEANFTTCDSFAQKYKLGRYDEKNQQQNAPSIKFPVKELGNCANFTACREFCSTPDNLAVCQAFAQKNGLSQGAPSSGNQNLPDPAIAQKIVAELGCGSLEACKSFCDNSVNGDKCRSVAQKYGLKVDGPPQNCSNCPSQETIAKMEKDLGCSRDACRVFCETPANAAKCSEVAKKYGMAQGPGPGSCEGCPPPETVAKMQKDLGCNGDECRNFCNLEANRTKCFEVAKKYGIDKNNGSQGGPGGGVSPEIMDKMQKDLGCGTPDVCRNFCQDPANGPKCYEAAKKYGIAQGPGPGGAQGAQGNGSAGGIPPEAFKELGCSPDSCQSFCQLPENKAKCDQVFSRYGKPNQSPGVGGLQGGMQAQGLPVDAMKELGCSGPDCGTLCQKPENSAKCDQVFRKYGIGGPNQGQNNVPNGQPAQPMQPNSMNPGAGLQPQQGNNRPGPGGCSNPVDCNAFCSKAENNAECAKFNQNPNPGGPQSNLNPGFNPNTTPGSPGPNSQNFPGNQQPGFNPNSGNTLPGARPVQPVAPSSGPGGPIPGGAPAFVPGAQVPLQSPNAPLPQ